MLRFGKGEIPADVYNLTAGEISQELGDNENALERESSKKLTWIMLLGKPR